MKVSPQIRKILKEHNRGINLDIGCGQDKQKGFVGLDKEPFPNVDIVHDLTDFPWPLPDESCSVIFASHIVEHIPREHGTFLKFMDEAWRVLKPGGQFAIAMPYGGSTPFWQDPTHVNGCNEVTWCYFDPLEPNSKGVLYHVYEPAPWKIEMSTWNQFGIMELLLIKRPDDRSYHHDKTVHYVKKS